MEGIGHIIKMNVKIINLEGVNKANVNFATEKLNVKKGNVIL